MSNTSPGNLTRRSFVKTTALTASAIALMAPGIGLALPTSGSGTCPYKVEAKPSNGSETSEISLTVGGSTFTVKAVYTTDPASGTGKPTASASCKMVTGSGGNSGSCVLTGTLDSQCNFSASFPNKVVTLKLPVNFDIERDDPVNGGPGVYEAAYAVLSFNTQSNTGSPDVVKFNGTLKFRRLNYVWDATTNKYAQVDWTDDGTEARNVSLQVSKVL